MKRKGIKAISRIVSFMLVLAMVTSLNGVDVLAAGLGNSEDYSEETVAEENEIAEEEETEGPAEIIISAEEENEVSDSAVGENVEVVFEDDANGENNAAVDEDADNQEDIEDDATFDENVDGVEITEARWGDGTADTPDPNKAYFWSRGDGTVSIRLVYTSLENVTKDIVTYEQIAVTGKGWTELNFQEHCREMYTEIKREPILIPYPVVTIKLKHPRNLTILIVWLLLQM